MYLFTLDKYLSERGKFARRDFEVKRDESFPIKGCTGETEYSKGI